MLFQNGSNKVAIELRVVQFWSEINTCDFKSNYALVRFLKSRVGFQTKLHSTHFNYHYSLTEAIFVIGRMVGPLSEKL